MAKPRTSAEPDRNAARPPATPAPSSGQADADWNTDEGENWRHAPVAPKDANPLDSLGKSISDTVTGSEPDRSKGPKT